MPHAHHRGCAIYYEVHGVASAPALLLVRGLGRSSRYWDPEFLGALGSRFRLVLVDNRGVGRSDASLPPYTTALMADDLRAVLDAARIERALVFGISLGGMIAQELALRHGARVARLALAATSTGGRAAAPTNWRTLAHMMLARGLPAQLAAHVTATHMLSAASLRSRPEVVERWTALARDEPRSRRGLLGQLAAGARHDTFARLPSLAVPTLALTGDGDQLIDPANTPLLASRILGARSLVLPGAGHDLPSDQPRATAAALTAFFAD